MENISYHKWATTIVINGLCCASNSRSQTHGLRDVTSLILFGGLLEADLGNSFVCYLFSFC